MCFTIFQKEKTSFYAKKTRSLKRRKIRIFPKRLVRDFGQKLSRFPSFHLRENRPGKCVAQYSRRKKHLSQTIKARRLTSRKLVFSPKGLESMILVKNCQFLRFFIAGYISEENVFHDTLEPFQAIKTRSLKSRKMGVFPKGLVHGFGLKVSVFPSFCFRQKNARKKCFTIFYKEKKSFYALKSSPINELINPQRFTHKSTDRNDRQRARLYVVCPCEV